MKIEQIKEEIDKLIKALDVHYREASDSADKSTIMIERHGYCYRQEHISKAADALGEAYSELFLSLL